MVVSRAGENSWEAFRSALLAASGRVADEADDTQVERLVVEQAAQLLRADGVYLALFDSDPAWLVVREAVGPTASRIGTRQSSGEGLRALVVESGQAFRAADLAGHPLAAAEPNSAAVGTVLAAALRSQGERLGIMQATRAPGAPPFTADDEMALQVLADVTGARLGASQDAAALRERARELAVLDPAWRPSPDQAGDFVLIVKNRKQVIDADEAACRILEYPRDILLQRTLADLFPMPPWAAQVDNLEAIREQMFEKSFTWNTTVRRRDGNLLPIRATLRALRVPDGFVVQAVYRDLSLEKRAQMETLQMEKMRLLEEISSALAHEFNTPLAVALGNIDVLLESGVDPEHSVLLQPARRAVQRIADTVRSIHRFARPVIPSAWSQLDLSVLAWEVVEQSRPLWEAGPLAEGRQISVRLETWPVPGVHADPIELEEGLRELLSNAVQALPQGGTIVVRTEKADGRALLSVADNGVGMSEKVRQFCLEPFFTTRRPAATGLGLNRVYHTAQRHRGRLEIQSAEGEGTRVTLSLPLVQT